MSKRLEILRKNSYNDFVKFIEMNTKLKIFIRLDDFKGRKEKIDILCYCGIVFKCSPNQIVSQGKFQCNECSKIIARERNKFSIDRVIQIIESDESGCLYISGDYKNNQSKLTLKCRCGELFTTILASFTHADKKQCNKCSIKNRIDKQKFKYVEVQSYIEKQGYELLTTEEDYVDAISKIEIRCKCGNPYFNNFTTFKYGKGLKCKECDNKDISERQKTPYSKIKSSIEGESSCLLLTSEEEYVNTHQTMSLLCECGDKFNTNYHEFKSGNKKQCNVCGNSRIKVEDFLSLFNDELFANGCALLSFEESDGCLEKFTLNVSVEKHLVHWVIILSHIKIQCVVHVEALCQKVKLK